MVVREFRQKHQHANKKKELRELLAELIRGLRKELRGMYYSLIRFITVAHEVRT